MPWSLSLDLGFNKLFWFTNVSIRIQPFTPTRAIVGTIACIFVCMQIRSNRFVSTTKWHYPILQVFAHTIECCHIFLLVTCALPTFHAILDDSFTSFVSYLKQIEPILQHWADTCPCRYYTISSHYLDSHVDGKYSDISTNSLV